MELHPLAKAAFLVMNDIGFDNDVQIILNSLLPVLPWDCFGKSIEELQVKEKAEQAINKIENDLKPWLDSTSGIAWLPVMCSAMYGTEQRLLSAGVQKNILIDTFRALKRFSEEYHKDFGEWGFDRQYWSWRQCCGCLLRIGTLEYEQRSVREEDANIHGLNKGDMVLSVHIPSDACLNRDSLNESFNLACEFYEQFWDITYPGSAKPKTIVCTSWLLSPKLVSLLNEDSGIRCFSRYFSILKSESQSQDYIIWLFGANADKNNLPEKTSLQRKVKQRIKQNEGIGTGTGELIYPYNTICDVYDEGGSVDV